MPATVSQKEDSELAANTPKGFRSL